MAHHLTQDDLKKRVSYCAETGEFRWLDGRYAGRVAGVISKNRRYIQPFYDGPRYLAYRLAWFYVMGEWPNGEIDHINCDSLDDRFANLRIATRAQNLANMRIRPNNKSGYKGVSFDKERQKWLASISINNHYTYLGRFETPEEAHRAYCSAALVRSQEFARAA